MTLYKDWAPTGFDTKGLNLPDQQDWIVAPCSKTRDSRADERANFDAQAAILTDAGVEFETHRFGHWACGWFEIHLVAPAFAAAVDKIRDRLESYPLLDDDLYSQYEHDEAQEVWANCYNPRERLAYIRDNRNQFEFRNLVDLLGCVRGKFFAGYASELLY